MYSNIECNADVIQLLKLVKNIMYKYQSHKYISQATLEAWRKF